MNESCCIFDIVYVVKEEKGASSQGVRSPREAGIQALRCVVGYNTVRMIGGMRPQEMRTEDRSEDGSVSWMKIGGSAFFDFSPSRNEDTKPDLVSALLFRAPRKP